MPSVPLWVTAILVSKAAPSVVLMAEQISAPCARRSGSDGEELPGSFDAFEFVVAAVVELEACSSDEHGYRG